jgi:hypothetical protein
VKKKIGIGLVGAVPPLAAVTPARASACCPKPKKCWVTTAVLALALALVALAASPAYGVSYPAQYPATDPQLTRELQAGVAFWHRHAGTPLMPITAYLAPSLYDSDGVDARGRGGDGAVWFKTSWLDRQRRRGRAKLAGSPRRGAYLVRAYYVESEIALVWHEAGHAVGLSHTPTGLMAPRLHNFMGRMPFEARVLRRSILGPIPRRKASIHRRQDHRG